MYIYLQNTQKDWYNALLDWKVPSQDFMFIMALYVYKETNEYNFSRNTKKFYRHISCVPEVLGLTISDYTKSVE